MGIIMPFQTILFFAVISSTVAAFPQSGLPQSGISTRHTEPSGVFELLSVLNPLASPKTGAVLGQPSSSPSISPEVGPSVSSAISLAVAAPKFAMNDTVSDATATASDATDTPSALPDTSASVTGTAAAAPAASQAALAPSQTAAAAFAALPSPQSSTSDLHQKILSGLLTAFMQMFSPSGSSSSSSNPLASIFGGGSGSSSANSIFGRRSGYRKRDLTASQTGAISSMSRYFASLVRSILAVTPSAVTSGLFSSAAAGFSRDPALAVQLAYRAFLDAFPDAEKSQLDELMRLFIDMMFPSSTAA